jgi:proline iminopeptidase
VEHVAMPDGTRLWTATHGQGIPIVLNHGGPGGYDHLEPVGQLIDDLACVHRYDQRGGGRSASHGPFTIAQLVADLESLRGHWRHDRWVVAGHSWGAHLALFYALTHPERTLGLIFMSGPPLDWGWGRARRETRVQRLTPSERAELAEIEQAGDQDERMLARMRELWWHTDFAERDNALRHTPLTAFARNDSVIHRLERDWQRQLDSKVKHRVRALEVPALVLHGEADPLPADGPRELADLLPGAAWRLLLAVGHIPWLERTTDLQDAFRTFLVDASPRERLSAQAFPRKHRG